MAYNLFHASFQGGAMNSPWTLIAIVTTLILQTGLANGQTYPSRPIRVISAEAGGTADIVARLIAQGLTDSLGQQVIVDNRGAASGAIASQTIATSAPDGHNLLFYSNTMWMLPFLRSNIPYDPVRDFVAITLAAGAPQILALNMSSSAKSVQEVIALAKANPGQLNFGSGGPGSTPHLAGELLKAMAGINIVHVPYKGSAPALADLIGNRLQLMFPAVASSMPHVKAGRLRALAVTSARPSALAPDLPTMAAAGGLPGYEVSTTIGFFAPARTPPAIIGRLSKEILGVLNRPDIKEKFLLTGVEIYATSPAQFAMTIKSDMAKWGKLIKDAGIRAD